MEQVQLNWIANFIWGIADDVLRDLDVRGKHRDVILPITVLRRLDAVLEPTKQAALDQAGIVHQDQALRQPGETGDAFVNRTLTTLQQVMAIGTSPAPCPEAEACAHATAALVALLTLLFPAGQPV